MTSKAVGLCTFLPLGVSLFSEPPLLMPSTFESYFLRGLGCMLWGSSVIICYCLSKQYLDLKAELLTWSLVGRSMRDAFIVF